MSRLRSLDSKISFFAFADIITAVSGVLIFIALLLATDLGRPTDERSAASKSEIERKLEATLAQQLELDAQNKRLQEALAAVETAPDSEKLKSDLARLRGQLADEQKKQASLASQISSSQATLAARDKVLGLTTWNATVKSTIETAELLTRQEARARDEMNLLEKQVGRLQAQLLNLRKLEGQVWLIPDKSTTTKEPVVVFVSGLGATIQPVDHPDQRKQLEATVAEAAFKEYLGTLKPLNEYLVFEVKPSGIALFHNLIKIARDLGFEVGSDALEEEKSAHISASPPIDSLPQTTVDVPVETPRPSSPAAVGGHGQPAGAPPTGTTSATNPTSPAPAVAPAPAPKPKSWWQRLLEWAGLG